MGDSLAEKFEGYPGMMETEARYPSLFLDREVSDDFVGLQVDDEVELTFKARVSGINNVENEVGKGRIEFRLMEVEVEGEGKEKKAEKKLRSGMKKLHGPKEVDGPPRGTFGADRTEAVLTYEAYGGHGRKLV